MTEETEETQPPLTIGHISYTLGELEGQPCLVVYDAAEDKTLVVSAKSKFYANAIGALAVLAASTQKLPKALSDPKIITARKPKLILPGSMAQN